MIRVLSYFLTISILTASVSFAQEGHRSELLDMTYRFINFAILFSILYFVLAKPLKEFLASRSDSIKKSLDEAKRVRDEAEKRYKEYQEKMERLTGEARSLRDSLVDEGNREKARIIEEANKAAQRIKEQTQFSGEQEIKKARQALKEETANLITEMTEAKLKNEIKGSDQERLVREYLSEAGGIH